MSTFQQTHASNKQQGISIDPDFTIPSCTVEDVDRAVFKLFDKDLDLFYKHEGSIVRVPIVFATGERFAILSRNKPLRDANDTLILPLISIARQSIKKDMPFGTSTNQSAPIVIKRRISEEDPVYQRIMNKENLQNQDDRAHSSHQIGNLGQGTEPGMISTRRSSGHDSSVYRNGRILKKSGKNNIYEIFELPNVRYYTASYDVTIWTQYTQQMNKLLMAVINSSHTNSKVTFRIETDKGYYFVAYLDSDFSADNNFSDFTDSERIVRYNFTMSVPAYVLNPDYEGSRNEIRRYISAPQISFDMTAVYAPITSEPIVPVASSNPSDYVLDELRSEDDPLPGQSIGSSAIARQGNLYDSATVGQTDSGKSRVEVIRTFKDPVTGEVKNEVLPFKQRNQRKGETVYRAQITDDLGTITVVPK